MKTIVAISTPSGKGGIGIVRLSGDDALAIAKSVFTVKSFSIEPNYMYFGTFSGKDFSDKGYLVYFKAPHSFTGEDVVELQLHGGRRILEGAVEECISHGANAAEPGEFTKRAYLNGKLALADAEAVIDMINAESAAAVRAGYRQMQGYLAKEVSALEDMLINLISALEASLDYPDEMEDEVLPSIPEVTKKVKDKLNALINSARAGRLVKSGINVALIGKTNVGKSSLLNKLVGCDRAIVTDIAGTTRDTIEAAIEHKGVKINFIDTAGIRQSDDMIEMAGVERSKISAKGADVVINVVDSAKDEKPLYTSDEKTVFNVYNKCDVTKQEIKRAGNDFFISAKYDKGVSLILDAIADICLDSETENGSTVTSARHLAALISAKKSLDAVDVSQTTDCILIDLKDALSSLGEITGKSASEEVVDAIFKNFCVGK